MANCKYSIIAAVHKFPDLTDQFLKSLYKYPPIGNWELILINNSPELPEMTNVLKKYPKAHVITYGSNVGTTKAWNTGMTSAKGRYLVVICSNCVITGNNWLKPYEDAMKKDILVTTCEGFMGITFIARRMIDEAHIWYDQNIFYGWPDVDLLNQITLRGIYNRRFNHGPLYDFAYIPVDKVKLKHLEHPPSCESWVKKISWNYYSNKWNLFNVNLESGVEINNNSKFVTIRFDNKEKKSGNSKNCGYVGKEEYDGCPVCHSGNWWEYD